MNDNDNLLLDQVSGYMTDNYEGVESQFTQISELPSLGYCRLVKAMRYGRWHVLKGLKKEYSSDASYAQRLRKELEMMMRLSHPGITRVYGMERQCIDSEVGMDTFIVTEWIDGVTLDEWLATKPNLDLRKRVAFDLLNAVGYMHREGVVHRDIKPKNIMITRNGSHAKLIDFGLADKDSYAIFKSPGGTEHFMAPEQMNALEADSRNDIYSVGIVLREMNLGSEFNGVIKKCLKPINDRYQTIDQIMDEIDQGKRRHRYVQMALVVIGVSLVAAGILIGIGYVGKQKLENPSGNFVFRDGENFVYTNWDNCNSTNTSVQYEGPGSKQIRVKREYRFNGNTWIVGELGFGCFHNKDLIEDVIIDCPSFGIQKNSFKGCSRLKTITMPNIEEVPSIGNGGWQTVIDSIFDQSHFDNVILYVPDVEKFRNDKSWNRFKHIERYVQ